MIDQRRPSTLKVLESLKSFDYILEVLGRVGFFFMKEKCHGPFFFLSFFLKKKEEMWWLLVQTLIGCISCT